jgi:DNA-binding winged helix-turn-helix (wHTH) protein/TolB-like protein
MPTKSELQKGFRIGDWEVLPGQGVMRCGEHEERPEPRVFEVLIALASRDGELVSRQELIDEIWEGRPTSDEPINRCLSQLRGHLGDRERPYQYIETLTRRGYRLNHKVNLNEPAVADHDKVDQVDRVRNQGRLWMLIAAIVVTIVIAAVIRGGLVTNVEVPAGDSHVRSIAVLPFDNLSGDEDDQYLVSGFKEELVHTLYSIPGFAVKPIRVSYPDMEVSDIARTFGVDAVLFGAVQRDGDMLKINYNIASRVDGINLSSGSITGQLQGIFGLQEKLALMVRDDVLGESPQQLISRSRPASYEAYDRYLRGTYALERRFTQHNLEVCIELFAETIQLDPQFGPAYLSLATAYAVLPDYRDEPREEAYRLAIETVDRGIAVDDSIRDAASAIFGYVYQKQRRWAKAEAAYLRATSAQVVDSNAFNWYSRMLSSVGRREDALRQILLAQKMDPSSAVINSRVATVYTWLGDAGKAAEFYERSNRLGGVGENHLLGNALLLVREGRLEEAREQARAAALINGGSSEWVDPVFAAMIDPSKRQAALAAIESASSLKQIDPRIDVVLRTIFGDVDGAMRATNLLVQPDKFFELDMLFLPELLPLRQHPDFLQLMQKLGIQSYWEDKGCVWLDDSISCPD